MYSQYCLGVTRYPESTSRGIIIDKIKAIKKAKVKTFKTSQPLSNEGENIQKPIDS